MRTNKRRLPVNHLDRDRLFRTIHGKLRFVPSRFVSRFFRIVRRAVAFFWNADEIFVDLANERHSERPVELHGFNLFANDASFLASEGLEPFANWLTSGSRSEENYGQDWFRQVGLRDLETRLDYLSLIWFARRLRGCGSGESEPAFTDQHQVANVNKGVRQISENADRIAPENEVNAHEGAAGDAPVPERNWNHAFALPL